MKERPILFSGPMVCAILEGRKTQTRRVVKPQPHRVYDIAGATFDASDGVWAWHDSTEKICNLRRFACPYGKHGELLWVKEAWRYAGWSDDGEPKIEYAAGGSAWPKVPEERLDGVLDIWAALSAADNRAIDRVSADRRWRSPIHMPRWASRLTLKITGVRVQRAQQITLDDAISEGVREVTKDGVVKKFCVYDRGDMSSVPWQDMPRDAVSCYRTLWDSINGKSHPWASNPWVWVVEFKRVGGGA